LIKPDRNNFAPRVGIAWQVFPDTVIRTGYGRFFMLFERAGSEDQMFLNPPWLINNSVTASVGSAGCTGSSNNCTANDMRLGHANPAGVTGFNLSVDPTKINLTTVRLRAVNPNAVQPEVDQWNFGVQHMMPGQIVMNLEYVGTKGTHLSILRNLNQIYFDSLGRACTTVAGTPTCPGITSPFVPYSNLGAIEYRDNVGNSTYHGLEASLQKRFSRGLSFNAAYTWSHSIDQAMEHLISGGSNSFLQNEHDLRQQRGASDFDYRHRFVLSYVYELPFGAGRSYGTSGPLAEIIGGWRISGTTATHTGRPFTIFSSTNNSVVQTRGGLTNALASGPGGGPCLAVPGSLSDRGGVGPFWFDTTQFSRPTAPNPDGTATVVGKLGNCSRNNMYGPNYFDMDLALARAFNYFGEGRSLEFRWETFNLLNNPQFGLPTNNVNSGNFGRITSLAGDPRVMQFALRFSF